MSDTNRDIWENYYLLKQWKVIQLVNPMIQEPLLDDLVKVNIELLAAHGHRILVYIKGLSTIYKVEKTKGVIDQNWKLLVGKEVELPIHIAANIDIMCVGSKLIFNKKKR